MKRRFNREEDLDLNSQNDLTMNHVETIVNYIKLLPEPPLPKGFVEEAMSIWRKSKSVLPQPVEPVYLNLQQKSQILFSQGLWKDVVLGVLLFLVGYFVLSASEMVSSMLILPIVGCIPLLVVLANTARHTLCGMAELSLSLRIPLHWYMQARLLLVGMLALLLNGGVTVAVFPAWGGETLSRVALLWCIPILINAAVALVLTARIRNIGQLVIGLFFLPVFWMILLSGESAAAWTASIELFWLWGIAFIAMVALCGTMISNARYLKRGGFLNGA